MVGGGRQRTVYLVTSTAIGWPWVRNTLAANEEVRSVGDESRPDAALRAIGALQPAGVLLDCRTADDTNIALAGEMRRRAPRTVVAVLADEFTPDDVLGYLAAGVTALLRWDDVQVKRFEHQLMAALDGDLVASSGAAQVLRQALAGRAVSRLTDDERTILVGLVNGQTIDELAQATTFSMRTVSRHIAGLKRRLGATNRTELVGAAKRLGIVASDSASDR